MPFEHAVFFISNRYLRNGYLVFSNLSKIIYHNITPSADYDATTGQSIARIIFANCKVFRDGAGGRTRTDMGLLPPDFESGAYTNFATPA